MNAAHVDEWNSREKNIQSFSLKFGKSSTNAMCNYAI